MSDYEGLNVDSLIVPKESENLIRNLQREALEWKEKYSGAQSLLKIEQSRKDRLECRLGVYREILQAILDKFRD